MIGKFFTIHDITSEQEAMDAAQSMTRDALEAVNTRRNRSRKMRSVQSNLNMLIGLCKVEQWASPLLKLKETFNILEQEVASEIANMFSIGSAGN
tara:strand:- start:312 stop:596 length:285 start_codon:yes stop_codon:yes gene_type:complete